MMAINKSDNVELAKLAEQTERYKDMVAAMKTVVEFGDELTIEERNLLSFAYKHALSKYRIPHRAICIMENKTVDSDRQRKMVIEYREKIEKEMKDHCYDILNLLDTYLLPKSSTGETKVFYMKMKGDYNRYLAEITQGNERQLIAEKAQEAYRAGFNIAKNEMPTTHPVRLGLYLNFSVFCYEILNQTETACNLAKAAFDDAYAELENLSGQANHESALILQLLRDNFTLWTNSECDVNDTQQCNE